MRIVVTLGLSLIFWSCQPEISDGIPKEMTLEIEIIPEDLDKNLYVLHWNDTLGDAAGLDKSNRVAEIWCTVLNQENDTIGHYRGLSTQMTFAYFQANDSLVTLAFQISNRLFNKNWNTDLDEDITDTSLFEPITFDRITIDLRQYVRNRTAITLTTTGYSPTTPPTDSMGSAGPEPEATSLAASDGQINAVDSMTIPFDPSKPFQVTAFNKNTNWPSSVTDTSICMDWNFTRTRVSDVLAWCEPMSSSDWHHLFDHLPCQVEGKLVQDSVSFNFTINSGAWMMISADETIRWFGYFKDDALEFFLSEAYYEKDE